MNSTHNTPRKVTILDVAKHANVSKSTVSLVLTQSDKVSDKSKAKVEQAIAELGYVYNREAAALRSKKSKLVALLINDLTNPYAAQLAVALEQRIYQMGLLPMLVNLAEDSLRQQQMVNSLKEYNVAAYIMCPAPNTDAAWQNALIEQGAIVLNVMRDISMSNAPCILPDNKKGTYLATQHMLEQGLTHLAFFGGLQSISDYQERLSGFEMAVSNAESEIITYVYHGATVRKDAKAAFTQLMQDFPKVQGIVCFSDVTAFGLIEAMREQHIKVGDDIKVVGFDDLDDSALMSPSLSSVHIDVQEIAQRSIDTLKEMLNGDKPALRTLVDVELNIRASSK